MTRNTRKLPLSAKHETAPHDMRPASQKNGRPASIVKPGYPPEAQEAKSKKKRPQFKRALIRPPKRESNYE